MLTFCFVSSFGQLQDGFVYVKEAIPSVKVDLRYFSSNNFVGDTIRGYNSDKLILSEKATEALKSVQLELNIKGLGLIVFDAYRPQRAVNHFAEWALKLNDTLMKKQFYPSVRKSNLFEEGYIAYKSGHTRGSTVDITLIDLKTGKEIDMGSPWDFFGVESWIENKRLTPKQKKNRKQLQKVMLKHNFKKYDKEWWHFTLKEEPFPDTYFDFEIK
ncbi:M15 family metallopeptidase [Urechidicola vernalis]|uniref:D-alanyl-D-alanine dipeptidase n=1 Tax=Urechidicola vernalis TaxID=3075600 RepID=A0ABU2Y0Q3_9FLAO|nr:M15 family metallopeptidase [Urechidicola sp. P050]MDT0551753.1 M15 family metallopeptidase [Urechidicola sp. P050]